MPKTNAGVYRFVSVLRQTDCVISTNRSHWASGSLPVRKVFEVTPPEQQQLSVLKALVDEPNLTQRELAIKADLSLGRTNYVLKALVEKGCIKLENCTRSGNKLGYLYLLTPKGVEEKVALTRSFLARQHAEFDALQAEIKGLEAELGNEKGE